MILELSYKLPVHFSNVTWSVFGSGKTETQLFCCPTGAAELAVVDEHTKLARKFSAPGCVTQGPSLPEGAEVLKEEDLMPNLCSFFGKKETTWTKKEEDTYTTEGRCFPSNYGQICTSGSSSNVRDVYTHRGCQMASGNLEELKKEGRAFSAPTERYQPRTNPYSQTRRRRR